MSLASHARAVDEPENVIKYRQAVMKIPFGGFHAPNITPDPWRGADRAALATYPRSLPPRPGP